VDFGEFVLTVIETNGHGYVAYLLCGLGERQSGAV
jgi:hypothetical protein